MAARLQQNTSDKDAMKKTSKSKDLSPKATAVTGGGRRQNDNMTLVRAAKPAPKQKDLPTRTPVKGGAPPIGPRDGNNDNLTFVRGAKPAKRDLPAPKDIKARKKAASVKGGLLRRG
jgi:hypothetical protein